MALDLSSGGVAIRYVFLVLWMTSPELFLWNVLELHNPSLLFSRLTGNQQLQFKNQLTAAEKKF